MTLVVAPCSHEAARYAVMHWHYSRAMPAGKLVKIGAWEDDRFIGAVLFGRGASPMLVNRWGLSQTEGCELVRVALADHRAPTTQIVAAALEALRRTNPGLRVVVSFADAAQGHVGTIYQAGNWIYTGSVEHTWLRVAGRLMHPKTLHSMYGIGGQSIPWLHDHVDPNAERVAMPPKHRYVMPLDRAMRRPHLHHLRRLGPQRPRHRLRGPMMETRTEWYGRLADAVDGIRLFEHKGWAVRQIVNAMPGLSAVVVYERPSAHHTDGA